MSYGIDWTPSADLELARIWNDAPDPNEVTVAFNEIERRLKYNPDTQGESRSGNNRILIIEPLAILFTVDHQKQEVLIYSVWEY
jgi:hypothetical protein